MLGGIKSWNINKLCSVEGKPGTQNKTVFGSDSGLCLVKAQRRAGSQLVCEELPICSLFGYEKEQLVVKAWEGGWR